ncbi:MAG: hypothetical protein A2V85_07160 [Chloroflexi bacterium RBG_16_72_14]|nr:MAG: hypothetical protein A2V85_07160 [Chloroflexi bacterium RBG_16_72_14]
MTIEGVLTGVVILLVYAITLAPVVLLVVLARRHLAGRRTRFDGLFSGIGRANAMNSHLQAGTPSPDDLAVPVPPRPDGLPRGRRRRRRR